MVYHSDNYYPGLPWWKGRGFGRQCSISRKTLHDSIKFSPSPWSTQPAPLATLHWLNMEGWGQADVKEVLNI